MRLSYVLFACCIGVLAAACHPGPVIDTGPNKQGSVGGTIAGVVTTTDIGVALSGRKVTVTETKTGSHYETTTAQNGGYTIKVPEGTYRIDVELRAGETLAKRPEPSHISNSDLDSGRDFMITVRPSGH